jgi:hypothetical protein
MKSQQMLHVYAKKNNLPYQRVGYDGTILNVSRMFPMSFDDNVQSGYSIDPSWVVPAVMAAASALYSQFKSEITLTESIGKLHCFDSTDVPEEIRNQLIEQGREQVANNPGDFGIEATTCDECYERGENDEYNRIVDAIERDIIDEVVNNDLLEAIKNYKIRRKNVKKT